MADNTQLFINNWSTSILDATLSVDTTTINIASADSAVLGAIAANEYFAATLSNGSNLEVIWIIANNEIGELTVIRAREGTSGLSYVSGDTIEIRNTKGTYENFVQRDATETLTQKTLTSPVLNTGVSGTAILDEDDMVSDSATQLATQQSIKKYVDDNGGVNISGTPVANDMARFTNANTIEGRSYAEAKADLNLVIGTDVLAQQPIGIADNNLIEVDQVDAASGEYAKFTANGLESKSVVEVLSDLNVTSGADVTGNNAPQAHKDTHDPVDGSDPLDTAAPEAITGVQAAAEGSAHTFARADHAHAIVHSIADNALVTMDDTDAADDDYAKFTANGLEGRSAAEAKTDLGFITDVVDDETPQLGGDLDCNSHNITGSAEAPQYQTIYIDAGAMLGCTTNGAESGTNEYAADKSEIDFFGFDPATDERVQFKLMLPENWDRSTIKAKFFWSDSGAATAAGTVAWAIKAVALSNDDPLGTTAFGTAVVATADTLLANNDMHITDATGAITVGGSPAINELIAFEIYRDISADTLDEDARLFGCEIQFKVDQTVSGW